MHGGGGFSLATKDSAEIESYARWVVAHGVTSFLPTICADGIDQGLEFVRTAAQAAGPVEGGATVLAVNVEGPFVSRKRRGALPKGWPAEPALHLADRLIEASGGTLRLVTVAPEVKGADAVMERLLGQGVVVSVGHTDATYEDALGAFRSGASHVTHAFNGMRSFHHRDPGPVLAAIDSLHATLEAIADGVHLHPATVRAIVRAAGPKRITLVSDAVPPAGVGEGKFRLGNEEARLAGDRVLLPDGTIAGGAATVDAIVRNVVEWGVARLSDAVRMASTTPARVLGLSDRKGRIAPGYGADMVALDKRLQVAMTWVAGRLVFARAEHFN